jgi:acetylornithine/succinyldiaminopimelate/putrescine aminotransferase/predicted amino acid dehydrogenase
MEHLVGQATISRDQLLAAAGLNVEYTRAEGDWLYMDDGHGREVGVLDLVGGFGASLLGHHHPEIRSVLQGCLEARRPMLAQGSQRRMSSELKDTLAGYLRQHTGQDYRICLLNTGTEAVEAALKHATYAYAKRVQRIADGLAANMRMLQTRIERGEDEIDEDFLRDCEPILGQEPLTNIDELLSALAAYNERVLNEDPFVAAFEYAFHGKTMGALSVTWNRDARLPFLRNNPHAVFIRDPAQLLETIQRRQVHYCEFSFAPLRLQLRPLVTMSALIYEPVRGEGGVLPMSEAGAELLCTVHQRYPEVPIISDEIQCGLGRTGRPVESQALGLPNDYMTFSKSLGGGLTKISALAVRADRYIEEFSMLHTSTFAEDDMSSAVAKRALEIIQRDGLARRCAEVGNAFLEGLRALQNRWPRVVKEVRGRGCMLAIELHDFTVHPSAVLSGLAEEKLLGMVCAGHLLHEHRVRVLPAMGRRNVMRVQPSAYLQLPEVQRAIDALNAMFELLDRGAVAPLVAYLTGSGARPPADTAAVRHPPRDAGGEGPVDRIGFVAHLIDADSIRHWDPSLAAFSDEELEELRARVQVAMEPRTIARRRIRSPFGREVELILYGVLMDSEAIETDMRFNKSQLVRAQVRHAYRQARLDGCGLVGFGGYTSIVTANCTDFHDEHPAVTTGNALTVAASLSSMRRAAQAQGINLATAHVAIVGAAGNIGHVHATLLGAECGGLTLLGRPGSLTRLRAVAQDVVAELCRPDAGHPDRVERQGSLLQAVRRGARAGTEAEMLDALSRQGLLRMVESPQACADADIVICASNSASAFLDASCFASGKPVLICDLAMPGDVDKASVAAASNLKLIRGGVVDLPQAPDFSLPGMLLDPGEVYACAGETILLGLAGVRTDFSKGAIRPDQVREIEALAKLHGFGLGREKLIDGF